MVKKTYIAILMLLHLQLSALCLCAGDTTDINLLVIQGEKSYLNQSSTDQLFYSNASERLSLSEGVFVAQGNGKMLSSLRINGASAAQTSVVWNNLKLNNALNGQVDLSLLPSAIMQMSISNLGSAYFGANSMAGTLLVHQSQFDSSSIINLNYGSFSSKNLNVYHSINGKRANHYISISGHHSRNDYPFVSLRLGKQKERLENAEAGIIHLLYGNEMSLNKKFKLRSGLWFSNSNRQLPSTSISFNDSSSQKDESWRAYGTLIYGKQHFEAQFSNAISIDNLLYDNPLASIYATYKTLQQVHKFETNYSGWKDLTLTGSYVYERQQSLFRDTQSLSNQMVKSKLVYSKNNWILGAAGSFSYYSLGYNPINYSVSVRKRIKTWRLKLAYGNSFRAPTLNDLYWPTGGNSNLLPEKGRSVNADISKFILVSEKGYLSLKGSLNALQFEDQIIWQPTGVNSIWQPTNIKNTYHLAKKVELEANWETRITKHYLKLRYSHLNANTNGLLESKNQLMFIPQHRATAIIHSSFKLNKVQITAQYQGEAFIDFANANIISDFILLNAKYIRSLQRGKYSCYIGINNITNTQYELVYRRPLPGINYILGINLKL